MSEKKIRPSYAQLERALGIASEIMAAADFCRGEKESCMKSKSKKICAFCMRRWLLAKAKKELEEEK